MVLADMYIEPGKFWEYCPREALRRVSKVLKDEFDLVCLKSLCATSEKSYLSNLYLHVQVVNAGFENEFYLLKSVMRYVSQVFLLYYVFRVSFVLL